MKKHTKISYLLVIFIVAVMIGFTGTFAIAKEGNQRSTRYKFVGEGVERLWIPGDMWMEDDILHMRFYKENNLSGTINEIAFTGHSEESFHAKIDQATGNMVVNGKVTFKITLNELEGTFYGPINTKIVAGIMDGKYTMQGAGDFKGWKLFGIVWIIDATTNGISGTILVPN